MSAARRLSFAAALSVALAGSAQAEDGGLGGFFEHLFGGGAPQQAPAPKPSDATPSPRPTASAARKRKKPTPVAAREPSAPTAPATPSALATKFVYVFGDSLAISAADGLVEDLADKPTIGVVDRARDASGLVRDDYFDWPKAARELAAAKEAAGRETAPKEPSPKDPAAKEKPAAEKAALRDRPDYVVVMLGINDMQPARDGAAFVDPLSDRWKAIYGQRVQAVVAPLRAAHIPVAWVGLPPMRSDKVNGEIVELNQILKENAERAGAVFIDSFDAFADQSGQFDAFGPNLEGVKVKLRGPDGIHFTSAGGKKLAHFLDAEIRAALGEAAPKSNDIAALPPDIGKSTDDINEQIRREMGAPKVAEPVKGPLEASKGPEEPPKPAPRPEAGPIASLAARPLSPGATLASSTTTAANDSERMLRAGEPAQPQAGRADDFTR